MTAGGYHGVLRQMDERRPTNHAGLSGNKGGVQRGWWYVEKEQVVRGRKGRTHYGLSQLTFKDAQGKADFTKRIGLTPLTDHHIGDGAVAFLKTQNGATVFSACQLHGPA